MPFTEMKDWQMIQEWFDRITGINEVILPFHKIDAIQLDLFLPLSEETNGQSAQRSNEASV
jgi:hypothetical protein